MCSPPIPLTRAAPSHLRASDDALVLGTASGIALVALPHYTVYAAVKAGLAHFDEAPRRELLDTAVRVVTVFRTDAACVDAALRPKLAARGLRCPVTAASGPQSGHMTIR